MYSTLRIVITALFMLLVVAANSQSSDSLQISLLTVGPGKTVESHFGHSAVRVSIPSQKKDIVYNYGTFDFEAPGFLMKFLRGKLPYSLSVGRYSRFLQRYHSQNRFVQEQILDLSPGAKEQVLAYLDRNRLPENREYMYDFFFDNCSSRIMDVLQTSVPGITIDTTSKQELTFRQMLHPYLEELPWTRLGIDLVIGSRADVATTVDDQLFLPDHLAVWMDKVRLNGEQVAQPIYDVIQTREEKKTFSIPPLPTFGFLAVLLGLLTFWKSRWARSFARLCLGFIGVGGLVLMFMWFFTDHGATKYNYNVFWLSPLYLLVALKYYRKLTWVLIGIGVLILLLSLLNLGPQDFASPLLQLFVIATALVYQYLMSKESPLKA